MMYNNPKNGCVNVCVLLSVGHHQEHGGPRGNQHDRRLSDGVRLLSEGRGWSAVRRRGHSRQDAGSELKEPHDATTAGGDFETQLAVSCHIFLIYTHYIVSLVISLPFVLYSSIFALSCREKTIHAALWLKWPKSCWRTSQTCFRCWRGIKK